MDEVEDDDYNQQQPPPPEYAANDPYPQEAEAAAEAYSGDGNNYEDDENNENATAQQDEYNEPEDVVADSQDLQYDSGDAEKTGGDSVVDENYTLFFSNYTARILYIAIMFFFFTIFSFSFWLDKDIKKADKDLATAYATSAAGAFFIFFGSLFAMLIGIFKKCDRELPFEEIFVYITMGLYVLGGILYVIAGMAVAATWNDIFDECKFVEKKNEGFCSAFSGMFFVEGCLVGLFAVIYGVDVWKRFMERVPLRLFINAGVFGFVALVGFFCYALLSTNVNGFDADSGGLSTIAAGYFFVFILLVIYVLILLVSFIREKLKSPLLDLIFAVVFLTFAMLIVIGYWAFAGGDQFGIFEKDKAFGAYQVGVSFVVLMMCFFMACDMQLGKYLARFVDEVEMKQQQSAAAAGNENPAAVQEYNPDAEYGNDGAGD